MWTIASKLLWNDNIPGSFQIMCGLNGLHRTFAKRLLRDPAGEAVAFDGESVAFDGDTVIWQ